MQGGSDSILEREGRVTEEQEILVESFSARTEKVAKRANILLTVEMAKEFPECDGYNVLNPEEAKDLYLTILCAVRSWVILNFPEGKGGE